MSTGITTWIHASLLKGVKLRRVWKSGSGRGRTAESALKLGRKVDQHFKEYAESRKAAPTKTIAGKMTRSALKALSDSGCSLQKANVFVKLGELKTHVDGIARRGRCTVVVELKTTSRNLEACVQNYKTACRNQPVVANMSNSEYLHHQLQLGWTTMAYRKTHSEEGVVGVVVIAAADGATVIPLDEQYAKKQFWRRLLAIAPVPRGGSAKNLDVAIPRTIPLWPGKLAESALTRMLGVKAETVVKKRVLMLSCGSACVASLLPPAKLTKKKITTMKEAVRLCGASAGYFVYPAPSGWRIKPLPAIK